VFKPSRRALVVAASFALGLSAVGPAAHAGLLGGGDSDTAVEGLPLPLGGDLLSGDGLLGLLGGDGLLGGVLSGDGVLGVLGGDSGEGLLGGGLPLVGGLLNGGDSPLGLLGGDEGVLAGEGLVDTLDILPLGIVPGGESVLEVLHAFSDSGSLVPGLQVLGDTGVLGMLGSF